MPRSLSFTVTLLALLLLTACKSARPSRTQLPSLAPLTILQEEISDYAITPEAEAKLTNALATALQTQTLEPFVALLNEEILTSWSSAFVLLDLETPLATDSLIEHFKRSPAPSTNSLAFAIILFEDKKILDYLVKAVNTHPDKPFRNQVDIVLRTLTGKTDLNSPSEWPRWWKTNRESFEFTYDLEELTRRFKIESTSNTTREVQNAIAQLGQIAGSDDPVSNIFNDLFGTLNSTLNEARDRERSQAAQDAIRSFRNGRISEAIQHFKRATTDNEQDHMSRFMMGICLLETGQYPSARDAFDWLSRNRKENQLSMYLSAVTDRRAKDPNEPILDTFLGILPRFERYEDSFWGWNDNLVDQLIGDQMVQDGIYSWPIEELFEFANSDQATDRDIAGIGHILFREGGGVFLRQHEQDHQNSLLVQLTFLEALIREDAKRNIKTIRNVVDRLTHLDPENGYFIHLQAHFINFENIERDPETRESPPLSDVELELFHKGIAAKKYLCYERERNEAATHVLQTIGFPIHHPEITIPLATVKTLAKRAGLRAGHELRNGHNERANNIANDLVAMGEHIRNESFSSISDLTGWVTQLFGWKHLEELAHAYGDEARAEHLHKLQKQRPEIIPVLEIFRVTTIPLPSLNRAAFNLTLEQGERGLAKRLKDANIP